MDHYFKENSKKENDHFFDKGKKARKYLNAVKTMTTCLMSEEACALLEHDQRYEYIGEEMMHFFH